MPRTKMDDLAEELNNAEAKAVELEEPKKKEKKKL